MKKLFLLVVAFAVYLYLYPESPAATWLNQQKDAAVNKFRSVSDVKVRLSPSKVYKDIEKEFSSFSSDEQAYVAKITESRQSVVDFYHKECGNEYSTTQLHTTNKTKLCKVIDQYRSLF